MNGKKAKAIRKAARQCTMVENRLVKADSKMVKVNLTNHIVVDKTVTLDTLSYPPGSFRRILKDSKKLN